MQENQQRLLAPRRRRRKLLLLLPVLLVIIAGSPIIILQVSKTPDPIPRTVSEAVDFPLYYPAKLPKGYSIPSKSFSTESNVVIYYAESHQGNRMVFSLQKRPNKVSLDDFNNRVIQDKVNVLSDEGNASVGDINGKTLGSLVTSKSWILITASGKVPKSTVADTLSAMEQISR